VCVSATCVCVRERADALDIVFALAAQDLHRHESVCVREREYERTRGLML